MRTLRGERQHTRFLLRGGEASGIRGSSEKNLREILSLQSIADRDWGGGREIPEDTPDGSVCLKNCPKICLKYVFSQIFPPTEGLPQEV